MVVQAAHAVQTLVQVAAVAVLRVKIRQTAELAVTGLAPLMRVAVVVAVSGVTALRALRLTVRLAAIPILTLLAVLEV